MRILLFWRNSLGHLWYTRNRFEGKEYSFSETGSIWFDARNLCNRDGATLAIISTTAEDNFLRETCVDTSKE